MKEEIKISELKVCAVVVTYNRIELLKECIEALLNQSVTLNKLIVIDNNSSDGTKEYLGEIANTNKELFEIILLPINLGGAGGFYEGIKAACEYKPDWIWIMDDDTEPEKNCLLKLMNFVKELDYNPGFVGPLNVHKFSNKVQFHHHRYINNTLTNDTKIDQKLIDSNNNHIRIDANSFVGPLISFDAVKKVGLPMRDFFIWDDDIEYTYRISRVAPSFVLTNCIIYHKDKNNTMKRVERLWKTFYALRNRLIWINTSLNGTNRLKANVTWLKTRVWETLQYILTDKSIKGRRLYLIYCITNTVLHGLRKKGGKFIDPISYMEKINNISK